MFYFSCSTYTHTERPVGLVACESDCVIHGWKHFPVDVPDSLNFRNDVPPHQTVGNSGSMIPFPSTYMSLSSLQLLNFLIFISVVALPRRANQKQNGPNKKVNFREMEKQILDKILGPAHYDRRIRPSAANGTGLDFDHPDISCSYTFGVLLDVCLLLSLQMVPPSSTSTSCFVASPTSATTKW